MYKLLREDYDQFNRPSGRTTLNIVQKFRKTENNGDWESRVRHNGVHLFENIAAMGDSVSENPVFSVIRIV